MDDTLLFDGLLGFIIALVIFIVFLDISSNLRTIKMKLFDVLGIISDRSVYLAEREEWKGNKEKAIEYYLNYLYEIKKGNVLIRRKDKTQRFDSLLKKIDDLGGKLPATGHTY